MNSAGFIIRNNELHLVPVQKQDEYRCSLTGRFMKGLIPWNKGIKGMNYGGKETQFKPGTVPANTKHDGCISIRTDKRTNIAYKYIRLAKCKWVLLNRYTWEQFYGPIPPKHVVVFKNGDTMNCDIENLELISMSENVRRNHNTEKASLTMKKLWRSDRVRIKYGLQPTTKLRIK